MRLTPGRTYRVHTPHGRQSVRIVGIMDEEVLLHVDDVRLSDDGASFFRTLHARAFLHLIASFRPGPMLAPGSS